MMRTFYYKSYNKMIYDVIIIGAGPAGLALAQCLSKTYDKILIVDREKEIGGCHRVLRVEDNIFTEHSPRVYSSIYKSFKFLLTDMNSDFDELFTPYKFTISEIGSGIIFSTFSVVEFVKFGIQYMRLLVNDNHGKDISIGKYMSDNNFSEETKQLVDRLTRLTDGAGADVYTLNQFLQLFNQQFFYRLYQPKLPNDEGLFKVWRNFLSSKNVSFMLDTSVKSINLDKNTGLVKSITVDNKTEEIFGDKIVLATPPKSFMPILASSDSEIQNSFMDFDKLKTFSSQTEYMTYISLTFHWDKKIDLPRVYGFPKSKWGLTYIVLSDYMTFAEKVSKTVITCTITYTDVLSKNINKTANQCTKDEILLEAFNQLKESYPNIEKPTLSVLSPLMSYNSKTLKWECADSAFITTTNGYLPCTGTIKNLYNVGTQNGKCKYAFTSIETAVANSMYLAGIIEPELKEHYEVQNITVLSDVFFLIVVLIVVFSVAIYAIYKKTHSK